MIFLIVFLVFVVWLLGGLPLGQQAEYKRLYLKRKIWIAFGRCPRCNGSVNFDRNGRAICPDCGRPC